MTFAELTENVETFEYRGKEYKAWNIDVGDRVEKFADVALENAMVDAGDLEDISNEIDCQIAFYVSPDDDVDRMIEEYNNI